MRSRTSATQRGHHQHIVDACSDALDALIERAYLSEAEANLLFQLAMGWTTVSCKHALGLGDAAYKRRIHRLLEKTAASSVNHVVTGILLAAGARLAQRLSAQTDTEQVWKSARDDALELLSLRAGLTPGERRVLLALLDGHSRAKIAGTLGISPNTLQRHVTNLLTKTHDDTTAELTVRTLHEALARLALQLAGAPGPDPTITQEVQV